MPMDEDFFDINHDGHLDAGEMAGYMDFVDYMNHDGVYSDGSGDDGSDDGLGYDGGNADALGFDGDPDYDGLDDGSAGGAFYSGTYGSTGTSARDGAVGAAGSSPMKNMNISSSFVDSNQVVTPEELKAGQEQFYVSQGNEYLKSSCISGVISGLLLAISVWIIKCVSHNSLLFDCIGVLYFASIVFCIPFWILFWKGLFYRIYKKENEAHLYVATPICTLAVVGYFVLLLFLSD